MSVVTQSHRLLHPGPEAAYAVQHVAIPATNVCVPQALIDRFSIPQEKADWLHRRAADAEQVGTFLVPRHWNGAAVMLICGSGDNRHAFKWLLFRKLLDRHVAVLTVDPPGHGQFTQVPCTFANVRRAARNWSDWLHAQPGVASTAIAGISFGGCQAADAMLHDPRFAALATISTPVSLPLVTRRVVAREAINLLAPKNLGLLRHQSARNMWAEWRSMGGAWFGEGLYDMIAQFEMERTIREIGARPKAFVHGKNDAAVPPINAQKLFDAAVPERELVLAPGATHLSIVLFEREMTWLAEWLAAKLVHSRPHEHSG